MKQTGFSLIELILIVGLIAILTTGATILHATVSGKARVDRVHASTQELLGNLESAIGQNQSYYGLTENLARQQSLVPRELMEEGGLSTGWGPLHIEPLGELHNGLRLTFEGVPADQCVEFVQRLAPSMVAIRVNGQVLVEDRHVDIGAISAGCTEGGTVAADRIEKAYGRKAVWETWTAATPPAGAP